MILAVGAGTGARSPALLDRRSPDRRLLRCLPLRFRLINRRMEPSTDRRMQRTPDVRYRGFPLFAILYPR
jgi:hypothetical protein